MPLFSKKKGEGSNGGSGRRKRETSGGGLSGRLPSLSSNGSNSGAEGRSSTNSAVHPRGPGAQGVGGNTAVFRVTVPDNVMPGEEFQVYAGNRIVKVRCPPNTRPGQSLQITVPVDNSADGPNGQGGDARGTGGPGGGPGNGPPDSPNVTRIPNSEGADGRAAYMVAIPQRVRGGQQFPVTIAGQQLMVTCPPNARPGMSVRIVPPAPPRNLDRPPDGPMGRGGPRRPARPPDTQMFEVVVPRGVQPGQPFALLAGGVRVLVTCPTNASEGQKIRFNLPLALTRKKTEEASKLAKVKLAYDKDGWTRTIRVSDMKVRIIVFREYWPKLSFELLLSTCIEQSILCFSDPLYSCCHLFTTIAVPMDSNG